MYYLGKAPLPHCLKKKEARKKRTALVSYSVLSIEDCENAHALMK